MKLPRLLIAAPSSGSGKTMVTCGILQALKDRGLKVASFKCGPDYIDPMFHSRVIGTRSKNLDAYFCEDDVLRYLFSRSAEGMDISIIEGVMGFYDGVSVDSIKASSHDVSKKLNASVILVIDCKGASISCVPVIKGFSEFVEGNNIKGIVLNRMSEHVYEGLKSVIEKETGVEVIGYVPRLNDLVIESRQLGLIMPDEVVMLKEKLSDLAKVLEDTLDIDRLIEIACQAPDMEVEMPVIERLDGKVKIGLADDKAFCFTYEDNLELLERCGAEIVRFSPMNDEGLPEDIQGLVISGGYPEMYLEELSGNRPMLEDIRNRLNEGMPCLAESGGFMYLHEYLEDKDGTLWPMVGYIEGRCFDNGRLTRFGYVTLTPDEDQLISTGSSVKGHEFHYWDSDNNGEDWCAEKTSGKKYRCIHGSGSLMAGYPHVFYYSNPDLPYSFLRACVGHRER